MQIISHREETLSLSEIIDYRLRGTMRGEWGVALDRVGEKEEENR